MDNLRLSKLYPFKNIDGKYCFINGDLYLDIPETEVIYDSNGSSILLHLPESVIPFLQNVKESLIGLVYEKYIFGNTSLDCLSEFYVSPHKKSKNGKNMLKCKCKTVFEKKTKVNVKIHISGMWFGEKSFGPYFVVEKIEQRTPKCLINTDSDSDSEINFD